jgi:hypothetical protein
MAPARAEEGAGKIQIIPRRLKPGHFGEFSGTTKVVPFQSRGLSAAREARGTDAHVGSLKVAARSDLSVKYLEAYLQVRKCEERRTPSGNQSMQVASVDSIEI